MFLLKQWNSPLFSVKMAINYQYFIVIFTKNNESDLIPASAAPTSNSVHELFTTHNTNNNNKKNNGAGIQ